MVDWPCELVFGTKLRFAPYSGEVSILNDMRITDIIALNQLPDHRYISCDISDPHNVNVHYLVAANFNPGWAGYYRHCTLATDLKFYHWMIAIRNGNTTSMMPYSPPCVSLTEFDAYLMSKAASRLLNA